MKVILPGRLEFRDLLETVDRHINSRAQVLTQKLNFGTYCVFSYDGRLIGFSHEEKWLNVLFLTEGEARVGNITLIPRPKAEVLMKVYHISELENRILQRPSV